MFLPNKIPGSQINGTVAIAQGGTGVATVESGKGVIGDTAGTGTVLVPCEHLLAYKVGVNMNVTTDQALTMLGTVPSGTTLVYIESIIVTNASASLTTAAGGVYTAASKGGTAVVGTGQAYSALDTAAKTLGLTIAVGKLTSLTNLYVALTTAQGGAATADFYVFGYVLPVA